MDASEIDVLVQRLVANPHDQDALDYAHKAGSVDPKSYAVFLERVGQATPDPAYASHWLSEAANVWSVTLGDSHRAARILMSAVDKDPTQETAAERLAQLYRERGEHKALVALLERRARAISPLVQQNPDLRLHLAGIHEELGKIWSEPPLSAAKKAVEHYRRAIELDSASAYAVYGLRELYKRAEQWNDAVPLFGMEQAIITDPERKLALYRDEAQVRKLAGDLGGATQVLRQARALAQDDPVVAQELGASILERVQRGDAVSAAERQEASGLFALLAQSYDGEHGLAYAFAGLDAHPGDDRCMQLAAHHARALGRTGELAPRWVEYLKVNPNGAMAREARRENGVEEHAVAAPVSSRSGAAAAAPPVAAAAPAPASPFESPSPFLGDGAEAGGGPHVLRTLEEAAALAARGQRPQALTRYKEVLAHDPAHPEALAWVEDYLRHKRQYAELRDVLMQAARSPGASNETRKQQLLEVAGICETQLRDLETAIIAWKQICSIDRGDASARDHLRRLLERGGRWDELANVLEQEALAAIDTEAKVSLEKKLAQLHEIKRKDLVSSGEAWARIASLLAGDELPIHTAVKLFDRAGRRDLACQVLAANAGAIEDRTSRGALYQKLGELYEKSNMPAEAGEAYVQAAEADITKSWEAAERCLTQADLWTRAAYAVTQRAELTTEPKQRAALFMRAAGLLTKGGDEVNALLCVEGASGLDPGNDEYAAEIDRQYTRAERFADLAEYYGARAAKLEDSARRGRLRKQAATLLVERLGDRDAAREMLLRALDDGDDAEVLLRLADDAEARGDSEQTRDFLHRLVTITRAPSERVVYALREAKLLAESLSDPEGAIARYGWILDEVDPHNRQAVQAIAALEEKQNHPRGVADALERELTMVAEPADKLEIARRLAPLYEEALGDAEGAVRAYDLIHTLDPEDYEATGRLEKLGEKLEDWPRVATLLAALAEIEGDEVELSALSRRLASVLADKLNRGDEALAALLGPADAGDAACRDAYMDLGDRLGWKGLVASKLVEWYSVAPASAARAEALRGAFDRFLEVAREPEAARVGAEICRSKIADKPLAEKLEGLAVKLKDLEALAAAHEVLVSDVTGEDRAEELVRQAEVLARGGVDPVEAQQHGETGLSAVAPSAAEPLLTRLAALTDTPAAVIDLYERQVTRCKTPGDRLRALARAAQVAASQGAPERARAFYDLALAAGSADETASTLELSADEGDRQTRGTVLRAILAEAFSQGGHGARDGGKTRALLLRRAAEIARRHLGDEERAFQWLGDALIAHVDAASLDALEELGQETGHLARSEATLGRALSEVFDGPFVRQLLARRIRLRRDKLGDQAGAVEDLKKLHELAPADVAVMDELSELLTELGDFHSMVHVLEDQILRSKDPQTRAELGRKVARLWEERLSDAREAADAWRRVLRMKPGDPEAQAGLERAKSAMLKHSGERSPSWPDKRPDSSPAVASAEVAVHREVAAEPVPNAPDALPSDEPRAAEPSHDRELDAEAAERAAPPEESQEAAGADVAPEASAGAEDLLEVDDAELLEDEEAEPESQQAEAASEPEPEPSKEQPQVKREQEGPATSEKPGKKRFRWGRRS
jgi:hypothetical protein